MTHTQFRARGTVPLSIEVYLHQTIPRRHIPNARSTRTGAHLLAPIEQMMPSSHVQNGCTMIVNSRILLHPRYGYLYN